MRRLAVALCCGVLGWCGCSIERHWLKGPVDQVINAVSGDRFFLTLEENSTTGYQWTAECDDDNVDVVIDHVGPDAGDRRAGVPGKAKVLIRVHRGYDGPSTVTFFYQRPWERIPARQFTVSMFKRTGDWAFWE